MKKYLLILCSMFITTILFAQKHIVIEPAILECHYKHVALRDTLTREPCHEDLMILRIGADCSQFFSSYTFYGDSLINDPQGSQLFGQLTMEAIRKKDHSNRPGSRTTSEYIYKRYPEGKITTVGSLNLEQVIVEEAYEPQNWIIKDSIKNVFGYECQLAECDFRGRKYHAWFSPEIAIGDGPWKFNGLPGLILEVYDKDRHYYYEMVGIRKTGLSPVTFYNLSGEKFVKTTRLKYLEKLKKFNENSLQMFKASTGIDLNPDNKHVAKMQRDFLEKDYHKKAILQKTINKIPAETLGGKVIEPAILECQYRLEALRDTVMGEAFKEDLMTLRAGKNSSFFYSNYTFKSDSLVASVDSDYPLLGIMNDISQDKDYRDWPTRTVPDYIYKNYPEGKTTLQTRFGETTYYYEEPFAIHEWLITDSSKEISGYMCKMATCDFRGRHYIAWFTPEIPVSDGPWKFNGLPGLILEVYDRDKHYCYTLVNIRQSNDIRPVTFYVFDSQRYVETTRFELLKMIKENKDAAPDEVEVVSERFSYNKKSAYDYQEKDYH